MAEGLGASKEHPNCSHSCVGDGVAGQLVSENELTGEAGPLGSSRRPLEEAFTALRKGALMLKHGRHGRPKVHYFRVTACDTLLRWRSASGSMKQVKLRSASAVVAGQGSEVFRRHPVREAPGATRSLSLHYKDEEGSPRTLDLTCADGEQFELWHTGLQVLVHRLRTVGAPVAAAGGAGSGAALLGAAAGPGGATPADVARCLGKSRGLQASCGLGLAVPAAERTPCDLLAWGSAHRAPPTAASLRSVAAVQEDCWQHRALPGLAAGAAWVDAYRAAAGRKHGAVISATGVLYTWGEGRCGKLGLGHDQDQAQPQRVRHGLEGQCVVAVACGDDCTAALTDGGDLFMWGRLHVDSRPQLVPLHVRGDLRGRRVAQVSCGPFHCAAVTCDGQLFTWGEGFGGKLGHGDQSSRAQPALVQALAGRQVLEAACGVWHTAAIVAEGPADGGSPFTQPHYSPLKGDAVAPADAAAAGSGEPAGLSPASPMHHGAAHHNRNNSTSSAFSEASLVHEGAGGSLYTWGGVNESVAFGSSEKHDSNKGCLGHGEVDLYRGQLLPTRVGGALEHRQVRHVAAGSHLTVAVTTGGRVFQMGVTGASGPAKHCPWEGANMPELVRGALQGYFVDEVTCGMHHVMAVGRPVDRRAGRPADHAPRSAFAWGRGSEGQLGCKAFDDSPSPLLVEGLKGRSVLQVTCGGSNSMAVCEHNVQRWEPDSREEADAAGRALCALMAEPKQLRIQAPGDPAPSAAASRRDSERGGSGMALVRRSLSMMGGRASFREGGAGSVSGAAMALAGPLGSSGPPDLSRTSSSSVRSLGGISATGSGRGPSVSFSHYYTAPHGGPGALRSSLHHAAQQQASAAAAARQLQRLRSDRTTSSGLPGAEPGFQRLVSIGSPMKSAGSGWGYSQSQGGGSGRRSTYAGGGGSAGHQMTSARSFTLSAGAARSDISSLSSWQHRPHSDDGGGGGAEHEVNSGTAGVAGGGGGGTGGVRRAMSSSADLAAGLMDDMRSGSSSAALVDELAEKNRIIERLQHKLEKMQRQQVEPPSAVAARTDGGRSAEDRLRESVLLSAGAFREMQQQHAASPASSQRLRPRTSPASGAGARLPARHTSHSPSHSAGRGSVGAEAAGEPSLDERLMHSMGDMLRLKEAHLAGQQAKLQAWAAELHQREAALAAQQARLSVGAGGAAAAAAAAAASPGGSSWGGVQPRLEPIPSESPLLPAGQAATPSAPGSAATASPLPANLSPAVRRVLAEAMVAPPQLRAAVPAPSSGGAHSINGSVHGGSADGSSVQGTDPNSPAAPGEWTEELEQGVFLTYTAEGGAKRLKRIRFSRSLFTADSAKAWYEANKHRLAPNGTPCAGAAAESAPRSQAGTPAAAATAQQQQQQQAAEGSMHVPGAAAAAPGGAVQSSLHYRQTSRNLSFDARELATFHERLLAAREQQQQPPAHSPPGLPLGPQRPSRLSRAAAGAGGSSASLPDSPFAAVGAARAQQEESFLTPRSGLEEAHDAAGGSGGFRSAQSTPASSPQRQPQSRQASPGPASAAESGGSSPIRASRSSGSPSTLSKQPSVPRGAELKAAVAQPLFTPRPALDKQPAGSSCSSGGQPEDGAAAAQPSPTGLSGAMQRLRRSLGGGPKSQ